METMIPTAAIHKAIEGGWKGHIARLANSEETLEGWLKYSADAEWETIALDSTFWYALCRALDWDNDDWGTNDPAFHYFVKFAKEVFHGGNTEAFWKEVLEGKKQGV